MIVETYLDKAITQAIREQEELERAGHISSGKLTASTLGQPTQWQVLKALGIGTRVVDDYTLRKFLRGRHIEDWLVKLAPNVIETQKPVSYKNVVGLADMVVDTSTGYDMNLGIVPHEVKSVTNAKFKRLMAKGEADENHMLQGGLYGLALGASHYAIDYVASDDLRVVSYLYPTSEISPVVDQIIALYEEAISKREVPVFEPRYKWQATKEYNQYPEWQNLTLEECQMALNYHAPDAWNNYIKKINQGTKK